MLLWTAMTPEISNSLEEGGNNFETQFNCSKPPQYHLPEMSMNWIATTLSGVGSVILSTLELGAFQLICRVQGDSSETTD